MNPYDPVTEAELYAAYADATRTDPVVHDNEMHRGQLRFAERFVAEHAGKLLYAHGVGWHTWDGARWSPDRDGTAMRAAVSTLKAARRELAHMEDDERKALADDLRQVESKPGLSGVMSIAGCLRPLAVAAGRLDADPLLFNAANGTVDLSTGDIRPHDPRDLITKVAGCGLDLDEHGPEFSRFVSEILPDREVLGFVQRTFGYAMLGAVREHTLPIFVGTGCNGKSTLLDALGDAFGDYAISADPEMLVERGGAHPTGQADLLGVRLAVSHETDEGRRLAAATVKRLTGGDKIRARKMRQDFFEFEPSHTIVLVTNHRPKVNGDDPALWRRIRVVPFDVVVAEPDAELPKRLALELPAILAWAYRGYLAYSSVGLVAPAAVTRRTDEYRSDSDVLGRFLDERTLNSAFAYVRARELYTAWAKWCADFGEKSGSEKEFATSLLGRGFEKKARNVGAVWIGLGLLDDSTDGPDGD